MNGFLDDLPELDLPAGNAKKKTPALAKNEGQGGVFYQKVRCPRCGNDKCPVYDSSNLPIRYHKCRKCGFNFKSIER